VPVNPLGAGIPAPNIAAMIAQELAALAADAQTLATQLLPGDVIAAMVLPSNGLTDLLDIGGLRVAAELPPTVLPGETITVMVTGFEGERINLQIVPAAQAAASETTTVPIPVTGFRSAGSAFAPGFTPTPLLTPADGRTPRPAPVAAPAPASAERTPPNSIARTAPTLPPPARTTGPPPVVQTTEPALPPAVRAMPAAPASQAPARPGAAAAPGPSGVPAAARDAAPVETAPRTAVNFVVPRPAAAPIAPVLKTIEARLAAAHVAPAPVARPLGPAGAAAPVVTKTPSDALSRAPFPITSTAYQAGGPHQAAPESAVAPKAAAAPQAAVTPRAAAATESPSPFGAKPPRLDVRQPATAAPAAARPQIAMRPALPPGTVAAAPSPAAAFAAARGPAAFAEPAALLRALYLPVSPTNLAAARLALDSPEKLPNALAALERALTNDADPRVATLITLTSFLARIDPRSPVLAAQIAAFADHVVTGREARIGQLASASGEAPGVPAKTGAPQTARPATAGPNPAALEQTQPPLVNERVAVIRAALDYDLKTQLLSIAADRAAGSDAGSPKAAAFDRAVAGALSAITALQLSAAATLNAHPDGIAFTLPVALPDGFASAHVRIDPNASGGRRAPLDGDNFHIAFVLETRHLGTVAIDVVTVGRAVTLSVKTEAVLAQRVFAGALERLSARLESLRYRVAKADAAVAPVAPPVTAEPPVHGPPPVADAARLVDVDA
jgi:hypothetical protein